MPRKFVPTTSTSPYHVTARTVNREAFASDLDPIWQIMSDYLFLIVKGFDLSVHSFVLMPNHFHLLVSSPPGNLSPALNYFMRDTARAISAVRRRVNQTYGSRNHKTVIESNHYFLNAYKYVYRNPVRAGLCKRAEDYRYSTLSGLMGRTSLVIPVAEDTVLFPDGFDESALTWINDTPDADQENEVRRALTRSTFSLSMQEGRKSSLEHALL